MSIEKVIEQIKKGSEKGKKEYGFNDDHDPTKPAQWWFQESDEGLVLFVVFYTLACRWSRCLGCNLPSMMSSRHIPFDDIIKQVDFLFEIPEIHEKKIQIKKLIVSNNGSVLDEDTFSSTALMYLLCRANLYLPQLSAFSMETRPEYVDVEELEFISRALKEGKTATRLELVIGFEAFDETVRNALFDKGLSLDIFEKFVQKISPYGFSLKCYFMLTPVPGISDKDAVLDIKKGIDYLSDISEKYSIPVNMHLNPTYVATGTILEDAFANGKYQPPFIKDAIEAVLHAKNKSLSIFVGLSDEGLAVEGGSFIRPGDEPLIEGLDAFNKTGDYSLLEVIN